MTVSAAAPVLRKVSPTPEAPNTDARVAAAFASTVRPAADPLKTLCCKSYPGTSNVSLLAVTLSPMVTVPAVPAKIPSPPLTQATLLVPFHQFNELAFQVPVPPAPLTPQVSCPEAVAAFRARMAVIARRWVLIVLGGRVAAVGPG